MIVFVRWALRHRGLRQKKKDNYSKAISAACSRQKNTVINGPTGLKLKCCFQKILHDGLALAPCTRLSINFAYTLTFSLQRSYVFLLIYNVLRTKKKYTSETNREQTWTRINLSFHSLQRCLYGRIRQNAPVRTPPKCQFSSATMMTCAKSTLAQPILSSAIPRAVSCTRFQEINVKSER